jgi:hypothetical protein
VAARKNPVVIDDAPDAVAGVLVPGLDDVAAADEAAVDAEATPHADDADATVDVASSDSPGRRRIVVGAIAAVVVASGAIWAAGSLGEPDPQGLPLTVSDPAVVVSALDEGGISCSGSVVSGKVATCNATVAVRVFDTGDAADAWVTDLLRDPLTSSAFGWVQHGNVVVSAPLNAAPEVAAALGPAATVR